MKKRSLQRTDTEQKRTRQLANAGTAALEVGQLEPEVRFELAESEINVVGSIKIAADLFTVWDTLVSYHEAPLYWANMISCRLVGEQRGTKFVQHVVKASDTVIFKYTVSLQEYKPFLIEWQRHSGSLETVKGSWRLTPWGSDTIATCKVHLDGGPLLPSWLLSSQLKGYLPQTLKSLKTLIEKKQQDKAHEQITKASLLLNSSHDAECDDMGGNAREYSEDTSVRNR
ncbi:MAG: SRPBCC family protein [Candidatus Melainabacteria bacterium]|nr:SRPBCC family protein [Candidatus Melainabacteria bacterium]